MGRKDDLARIVGAENVQDGADAPSYLYDQSFGRQIAPAWVVKPQDAEAVQGIVKWANESLTPLVPVSSGAPHIRGDAQPSTGGAVAVDLSEMDNILSIDRLNRVTMVEPGVTFGKLQSALEKEGMCLNMPLMPRSTKSVIASMLEREPVVMPKYHWDAADPLCCMEVVYGTGDFFRTGAAAGPGTVEELQEAGVAFVDASGPFQVDYSRFVIGAQGSMGIVTWATARCELLPTIEDAFFVGSEGLDGLFDLVHWLIRLGIANECLLLNKSSLVQILKQVNSGGSEKFKDTLPNWILFFCVGAYDYFPEERIAYQTGDALTIARRNGLAPVRGMAGISASHFLKKLRNPSETPYWKHTDKGGCHDLFFLTTYDKCPEMIRIVSEVANDCGYPASEMGVYFQPIVQGTSCHCEFQFYYSPDKKDEIDRIRLISATASKKLMNRGAFFSRPYGSWTDPAFRRDAASTIGLKKIKTVYDPNNIMNPGKLCF